MSYARRMFIPYEAFDEWLNLPEGFRVDLAADDVERFGLSLRVRCPEREEFEVKPGLMMPEVRSWTDYSAQGAMKMWWPEFGQERPPAP